MSEHKDRDKLKTKKTLSLKLGSKPIISPKKNIEVGKTLIVEKKRFKRSFTNDNQSNKSYSNKQNEKEKNELDQKLIVQPDKKSGVLLKPLSKDEQRKILGAESKKDKKDAIAKIRTENQENNIKKDQNLNETS